MNGPLIFAIAVVMFGLIVVAKTAIVVPQQSAFVVERLGRYNNTLARRLPHPGPVRRRHPLPALAEGDGDRHPGAGLHHARQRAGPGRRRPLPEGPQPRARLLRHLRLPLRDLAAGPDDAAQRDRQDRARPHLRGAHQHQHAGGQRARQGDRAVGRQGAALRDQEHHAAGRRARRDGEADARRAREARGDPDLGRPARRGHQQRRGREAAGHQGLGSQASSSRSTRPRARRRPSSRSPSATAEGIRQVAEAIQPRGGFEAVQLRVAEQYVAPVRPAGAEATTRSSCRPTSPTSPR